MRRLSVRTRRCAADPEVPRAGMADRRANRRRIHGLMEFTRTTIRATAATSMTMMARRISIQSVLERGCCSMIRVTSAYQGIISIGVASPRNSNSMYGWWALWLPGRAGENACGGVCSLSSMIRPRRERPNSRAGAHHDLNIFRPFGALAGGGSHVPVALPRVTPRPRDRPWRSRTAGRPRRSCRAGRGRPATTPERR